MWSLRSVGILGCRIRRRTQQPTAWHSNNISPYNSLLDQLQSMVNADQNGIYMDIASTDLHPYWYPKLMNLEKYDAKLLLKQLITNNALGYLPSTTASLSTKTKNKAAITNGFEMFNASMVQFICQEKQLRYPTKVLLVRVGSFYETYGVDAVIMVEVVGLQPMGGKARAGCPVANLQPTLDRLVAAGYSVAVYEEKPVDSSNSTKSNSSKLKERYFTQELSPPLGSLYYYNELCLQSGDIFEDHGAITANGGRDPYGLIPSNPNSTRSLPYMGLFKSPHGYSISFTRVDEKSCIIQSRLSFEGVKALISLHTDEFESRSRFRVADPIYIQGLSSKDMKELGLVLGTTVDDSDGVLFSSTPILHAKKLENYSELHFHEQVAKRITEKLDMSPRDVERMQSSVMQNYAINEDDVRPRPIYLPTALQVGLLPNIHVPLLVPFLLGTRASGNSSSTKNNISSNYSVCAGFLNQWLLCPPSLTEASHLRDICRTLSLPPSCHTQMNDIMSGAGIRIPAYYDNLYGAAESASDLVVGYGSKKLVVIDRLTRLLEAKQCNMFEFHRLGAALRAVLDIYAETSRNKDTCVLMDGVITPALQLTCPALKQYQSPPQSLIEHHSRMFENSCRKLFDDIEGVVWCEKEGAASFSNSETGMYASFNSDAYGNIPGTFFEENESSFRRKISAGHGEMQSKCQLVYEASQLLCEAVESLRISQSSVGGVVQPVEYDTLNNKLYIKLSTAGLKAYKQSLSSAGVSSKSDGGTSTKSNALVDELIAVYSRKNEVMPHRYTTSKINDALGAYLSLCEDTKVFVMCLYKQLSANLYMHLDTIRSVAAWNIILSTAVAHVRCALGNRWSLPSNTSIVPLQHTNVDKKGLESISNHHRLQLPNLHPYWMEAGFGSVGNDVDMHGMMLLTAPNMSGKSTLMRSALAASLLGNAGLYIPCVQKEAISPLDADGPSPTITIPFFTNYYLRTSSYDSPTSKQSAFALEMEDLSVLIGDCCTQAAEAEVEANRANGMNSIAHRSLVMVDELGKGTSSRDAAALAGAVIEELSNPKYQIMSIFATHLHEILKLPLDIPSYAVASSASGGSIVSYKTMEVKVVDNVGVDANVGVDEKTIKWTYRLIDGVCTDSLALHTAQLYRLPNHMVKRAKQLGEAFNDIGLHATSNNSHIDSDASLVRPMEDIIVPDTTRSHSISFEKVFYHIQNAMKGFRDKYKCNSNAIDICPNENEIEFNSRFTLVNPGLEVIPPSFEGKHLVYILEISDRVGDEAGCSIPYYYVGETGSIQQRIKQHVAKYKKIDKNLSINVLVVEPLVCVKSTTDVPHNLINNRTTAKRVETVLINYLKAQGVDIRSGGIRKSVGPKAKPDVDVAVRTVKDTDSDIELGQENSSFANSRAAADTSDRGKTGRNRRGVHIQTVRTTGGESNRKLF